MFKHKIIPFSLVLMSMISSTQVYAHDPIFGQGPHTLFKNGFKVAIDLESDKQGDALDNSATLDVDYGLTGDWIIGFDVPYEIKADGGLSASGVGDMAISTKYRFWRGDSLGLQQSMAISLKVIGETGNENESPSLGTGTTDAIVGLSYGYEGRSWYRWVSLRHRENGTSSTGVQRGSKDKVDFVVGWRPTLTSYTEPDMVYMLELNGELGDTARRDGNTVTNTGGDEWFISPGFMWTVKNFAIRGGVQLPVSSDLNGTQEKSDYRAKLSFEWHL